MRSIALGEAALIALLALSCGASGPAVRPAGVADSLAAFADSIEITDADELFVERHAALVAEIERYTKIAGLEARVAEASSYLGAAEELYLRGKTLSAIRLLDEGRRMLKRDDARP